MTYNQYEELLSSKIQNLVHLSWEYTEQALQPLIPKSLKLASFQGKYFLSLQIYQTKLTCLRKLPVPFVFNSTEMDLYTYVEDSQGTKGIWYIQTETNNSMGHNILANVKGVPQVCSSMESHLPLRDASNTYSYVSLKHKVNHKSNEEFRFVPQNIFFFVKEHSVEEFLLKPDNYFCNKPKSSQIMHKLLKNDIVQVAKADIVSYGQSIFRLNKLSQPSIPPSQAYYIDQVERSVHIAKDLLTTKPPAKNGR